ncbi:MAG TPA: hypothetical protein DEA08_16090 [Planctomycetes bacterium]|nr:hypothetical protein [Planctomycetota bacterium]
MRAREEQAAAAVESSAGFAGYLLGGILGLGVLFLLWQGTTVTKSGPRHELPHLAILAEFDDLVDPATRADLVRFHRELIKAVGEGMEVQGPLNAPIILPLKNGGLLAQDLDQVSEQEMELSKPYFAAGGWLVPRLYDPELKSAIFRAGPLRTLRFPAGTREKVEELLQSFADSKLRLTAYSHDLRLNSPEARTKINEVFGVQVANTVARVAEQTTFKDATTLLNLYKQTHKLTNQGRVRSVTTLGSFWIYALSIRSQKIHEDDVMIGPAEANLMNELTKQANIPPLVDKEGRRAMVQVTTDAEGEENLKACHWMAGNASGTQFVLKVRR